MPLPRSLLAVLLLASSATAAEAPPQPKPNPFHQRSGQPETPGPTPASPPARPDIFKLADLKAGMVGEAWTVFSGMKPEPFRVRVVAILRNFNPKQDVILIRAEDERVEHSGIAQGMSGSPVYIDGKIVGAIAYAWAFSKDPLGGVTPIESMLAERDRPRRLETKQGVRRASASASATASATPPAPLASLATLLGLPDTLRTGAPQTGEPRLLRASLPLTVAGLAPGAVAELDRELRPFGLVPVQTGAGPGRATVGAPRFGPGDAIAVELVRGDMSIAATGTVTYVDGNSLLAFGHPFFGGGETYLPVATAEVHAFLPSVAQSFKLASPVAEAGVMVQDRPSCITADLGQRIAMIPVQVRVTGPEGRTRSFRAEVARHERLTSVLTGVVLGSAIADAEPDVTDVVAEMVTKLTLRGGRVLTLRDNLFSPEGLAGRALAVARGPRALAEVLANPFEDAEIDGLDVSIGLTFKRDVAEIVNVSLPSDEVRPGQRLTARVTLRPYGSAEISTTVPVTIPRTLGRGPVRVEVASGALVRPDLAPPETLAGYLDNMEAAYGASALVVSVQTTDDAAYLRGRKLGPLPAGAADALRSSTRGPRGDALRVVERAVIPAGRIVAGRQSAMAWVDDDALGITPHPIP